MLDGLKAEGEAEVLVHYTLSEDIRALKRVKDAMAAGRPLPMALREQRVWGLKERLFERVLPRLTATALDNLLHSAHLVDGIVKGLKVPGLADRRLAGAAAAGHAAVPASARAQQGAAPRAKMAMRMNALNVAEYMQTLGLQAKQASAAMARADAATKNKALARAGGAAARQRRRRCRPTTPRTSNAPPRRACRRPWSIA